MIAALTMLAVGCGKDNNMVGDGRLRLFSESMNGDNGAKIIIDPSQINAAKWVVGELIDLNGTAYPIEHDERGFFLNTGEDALPATLYAVYPSTMTEGGNDISVTNFADGSACAVVIHSLAVHFGDAGADGDTVVFPMAAMSTGNNLRFRHLTGGLRLTIENSTGNTLQVARLVVRASNSSAGAAIYQNLLPPQDTWVTSLMPGLPGGEVGETSGDLGAEFVSDMTLYLYDQNNAYKSIDNNGSITFCIPMLAKGVKYLQITGYGANNTQLFSKETVLETAKDIERNKMYNIPVITINQ